MSLAMSAAPFDDNTYKQNTEITTKRKGSGHNKTQKRTYNQKSVDVEKMTSVLQSIHNEPGTQDDEDDEMGDFHPPQHPVSSGVEKTLDAQESPALDYLKKEDAKRLGRDSSNAQEFQDDSLELNNYQSNYNSAHSADEYYKKFVPNYTSGTAYNTPVQPNSESANRPYYTSYTPASNMAGVDPNVLLEKLNYMIHLLEEQQDEKIGSVTEEVILYSFLGIFIIFLVDSFTKVGKYKR
mgnify:CR=1 FL=1